MNLDELTLGQIKQLKELLSEPDTCLTKECYGKQIVILQRGWVVVGDLVKCGSEFILDNGSVIRIWGTTNGLGELAMNGPTSSTKLDPIPETKFHELTVIAMLKCDKNKWK